MKTLLLIAALAAPTFAEKTGTARPALSNPPAMDGCDASDMRAVIGKRHDAALEKLAQDASGARTVRVIRPGDMVTMDLREDRLNLELDAAGTVVKARCG